MPLLSWLTRIAIVGLTTLTAGTAMAQPAPIPVRFTVQPGSIVTPLVELAVQEKFFDTVGIAASTVTVGNGPAAVTALASGSVDVATNAPEVFLALAGKGQSLQMFIGQARNVSVVVARPGLELPTDFPASFKALKGRKIGVTSLSSATQCTAIVMLHAAGLQAADVQFVAVGTGGPAALANGIVDVAMLSGAQVPITERLGGRIVVDLSSPDRCPSAQLDLCAIGQIGMWGMGDWLTKNPVAVGRIRKAIAMADVFLHDPAHAAAARRFLERQVPADSSDAVKKEYVDQALTIIHASFARGDLQRWIDIDLGAGVLAKPLPVASVFAEGTPETDAQVKALAQ